MFLGTIELNESKYDSYESFHQIISDFKDIYNLSIMNIQTKDKNLEYQFRKNDIEEDEIIYVMNYASITLSESMGSVIIKLEVIFDTFDKFVYMYRELERLTKKYFK